MPKDELLKAMEGAMLPRPKPRYETRNLGDGAKRHAVYDMPIVHPHDYWLSVTDVPCPLCDTGSIRWYEAGFVPGARICDACGKFFLAKGSIKEGARLIRDSRFDRSPRCIQNRPPHLGLPEEPKDQ
jgi:hypothetical protein